MSTFRGMDGSVKVGAATVLNVTQWTINTSLTILDTTYMGLLWETKRSGQARWSGSFNVNLDYGDTLGQKVLLDFAIAATPDGAVAAASFLFGTGKLLSGALCLSSIPFSVPMNGLETLSFNFEGNGALALTWA